MLERILENQDTATLVVVVLITVTAIATSYDWWPIVRSRLKNTAGYGIKWLKSECGELWWAVLIFVLMGLCAIAWDVYIALADGIHLGINFPLMRSNP